MQYEQQQKKKIKYQDTATAVFYHLPVTQIKENNNYSNHILTAAKQDSVMTLKITIKE